MQLFTKISYFKILKRLKYFLIVLLFTINSFSQTNQTNFTTLTNQGATIRTFPGSTVRVAGSVLNNTNGQIFVNGNGTTTSSQWYVSHDIQNQQTITADGHIHLNGNWINNGTYNYGVSTVFLEGGNQNLAGTTATTFYNLTLAATGSGVKTQFINKSCANILALNNQHLNTGTFTFFVLNTSTAAITRDNTTNTAGFVSSANGGFLSRATNSSGTYLFPTGSTANNSANTPGTGTTRYRPVEIIPNSTVASAYTVRMANVDATSETFDRSLTFPTICSANANFYHQINRTPGTANADIKVYYIPASDGTWQGLARWNLVTSPADNKWDAISGSSTASTTAPFSVATKTAWSNFDAIPYILYNIKPSVTVACSDICPSATTSVTATPSPLGTYNYSWTVPTAFTPNPGNTATFNSGIAGTYSVTITDPNTGCVSASASCSFVVNQPPSIINISPP